MAFNILPVELNQHIASFLPEDKDLCRFTLICRQTHTAINSPCSAIWRLVFVRCFDLPPHTSTLDLKRKYVLRKKLFRVGGYFVSGQAAAERRLLELFKELINESYINAYPNGMSIEKTSSNNIKQLLCLTKKSQILHDIFRAQNHKGVTADPLLQTIQVLFTHWSLDLSLPSPDCGFPLSQKAVYGHPKDYPMFLDESMRVVNIEYLLHIANFFKYHLTRPYEGILADRYESLNDKLRPKAWEKPLRHGLSKLGSQWIGSYAYLHDDREAALLRKTAIPGEDVFIDSIDTDSGRGNGFQSLELDFENVLRWPSAFEEALDSIPTPALVLALNNPFFGQTQGSANFKEIQGQGARWKESTSRLRYTTIPVTPPRTPKRADHLASRIISKAREGIDYLPFTGEGIDAQPFHCSGNLHALPPQQGIAGWQRITIMKVFDPESPLPLDSWSSTPDPFSYAAFLEDVSRADSMLDIDPVLADRCWAYEGVVLPGGMVMLGRWWFPSDETGERICTGPWIFWNVDA